MKVRLLSGLRFGFAVTAAMAMSSFVAVAQTAGTSSTTLAATPPMGWNSWNHFAKLVTEADVRGAADALVTSGMRDAGYVYVNIDDGWEGPRDAQGRIQGNEKFPDMKALAAYVHAKGLKLGIYSSPGPKTCAGFEGSYGHEQQDAETYASWGVDYLKYDLCSLGGMTKQASGGDPRKQREMVIAAYERMHQALLKTGRPIVYSISQYGFDVWNWGPSVGANLWRTTADIKDNYFRMAEIGFEQVGMARYSGPGHWNDVDMLEVGNGGMSPEEYRTHLSLWAILASPFIAGNDLSHMTGDTRDLLTDREVLAIDQDSLGMEGDRVSAVGPCEVWIRPLQHGQYAVGLFNRSEFQQVVTVNLEAAGIKGAVQARDVWLHRDVGSLRGTYSAQVPAHGVVLLRISK